MCKIKICGLTRREDIEYVNELKPDFIGFIMAAQYPKRYVDDKKAAELKRILSKEIESVGVFVNDSPEHIIKVCRDGIIDIVQLHGEESAEYTSELKKAIDVPIIKAVRVGSEADIVKAQAYPADYLLLDAYVHNQHGGSGKTFARSLIPANCKRYFLAGGLCADNLAEAVNECHPYAVDLSSGVETDGFKDKDKIRKVIKIVRSTGGRDEQR